VGFEWYAKGGHVAKSKTANGSVQVWFEVIFGLYGPRRW